MVWHVTRGFGWTVSSFSKKNQCGNV